MDKLFIIFILSTIVAYVSTQNLNEIDDDVKNKLNEAGLNLDNFNQSSIPTEEIEKAFREKCEKQGADPSVIDEIKAQQSYLQECIQQQVNITKLQEEVEKAKETGSMDEVFGKYCKKYPDVYNCFNNVTDVAMQCMNDAEKDSLNITMNIVKELKEFMCFKDGDRIAMFVAEGGLECMQEQQEAVQQCINSTIGASVKVPKDLNTFVIPDIVFSNQTCENFETIRDCVVLELEKCKDTTPANIVDALFKFLRKLMPCKKDIHVQSASIEKQSGSSAIYGSSLLILVFSVLNYNLN